MIHLLTIPTIFIPQPNNCFLQLVGTPMDGLRTLAKVEEEARACADVERKRAGKEEALRAGKRRKRRAGGMEGETGGKCLSRHTSGVSIADGVKIVWVISLAVPGLGTADIVLFSQRPYPY